MKIDKYIVIESGDTYSSSSFEELVKSFLGDDYYDLSDSDKKKRLEAKAYANMLGTKNKITDYVLTNEKTFIYSLLLNTNIVILEEIGVGELVSNTIDKKSSDNYVLVNSYAKDLLKKSGDTNET